MTTFKITKAVKPEVTFSNPDKLPLEHLKITVLEDGINIKVPAMDKRWADRSAFTPYLSLVGAGGKIRTGVDLEEWLYEAGWFRKDMEFLLRLQHYEFWSYMVYQKAALNAVVSFLKKSTPFYMDLKSLSSDEHVLTLYEEILTDVVRIICRIITNKESEEEWITKETLKEWIYSNFLVSIPMVFDLLISLGEANLSILKKIVATLFIIEPRYTNDLTLALQYFPVAYQAMQAQAENEGLAGGGDKINEDLDTPYDDLVLFILDSAYTLSMLLEVYPEACRICCDINLATIISKFYDNIFPTLCKNIYMIDKNAKSLSWINQARVQFLKAFRNIVYVHIQEVLENPEGSLLPSEKFVAIMTECLADQLFVIDYQNYYPLELDVDILKQACKDLDEFQTNFVVKGFKDEAASQAPYMIGNLEKREQENFDLGSEVEKLITESGRVLKMSDPEGATSLDYDDDKPSTSKAAINATANETTSKQSETRNIEKEVASVLEVLPHLGDGFVRRVLDRYDKSEDAIAAILEQNLPPDLMNSDQSEVYIPPDLQDQFYQQTGIKRYNVFDGDKYDIMTQDNPDCIIKIGKGFPDAPQSLNELLDDKTELNKVRHRYQEFTLVDEGNDDYEDEYDDSYDAILESEPRVHKTSQFKAAFDVIQDDVDDEDEGEEEEVSDSDGDEEQPMKENEKPSNDKRMNFCENPEDVRARYEARRAAKYGNNPPRNPQPQKSKDVVGAAKGQGQEKQVVINRQKKEANKSSRANHNRKAGASFKRSKGMIS